MLNKKLLSLFCQHIGFDWYMRILTFSVIILALSLLGACATIPVEKRAGLRKEINQGADKVIETFIARNPVLKESLDTSVGYFVGQVSAAKVPVVGVGTGFGLLYDSETKTRTYMNIRRFDIGVGIGASRFRVLVVFQEREMLEQFRTGTWKSGIGVETAAGEKGTTTVSEVGKGTAFYLLPETGAVVTAAARLVRLSVNEDLTDTGVSEVSIPNKGLTVVDRQGEDAPRTWEHKLPFLAQKVIDKGYDLPLPYGIGLTYAKVDQDQLIDNLRVGINNISSKNDTLQLKLDAWLFPFMNVFALFGKIDGSAPVDIDLDGNGMLDHLDMGFLPIPIHCVPCCRIKLSHYRPLIQIFPAKPMGSARCWPEVGITGSSPYPSSSPMRTWKVKTPMV
jgi:hypothetical protein